MEGLFDIPVIGLRDPVRRVPDPVITVNWRRSSWRWRAPIALGALCGFMNERIGRGEHRHRGHDAGGGIRRLVRVGSWSTSSSRPSPARCSAPRQPSWSACWPRSPRACASRPSTPGCRITIRADQIISGTIINIFAFGVTGYLNLLISGTLSRSAGKLQRVHGARRARRPARRRLAVQGVPATRGPSRCRCIVLAVVLQILLLRSRWGLRTRAVGEHPKAAETVGIDVIRLRYRNVILGGSSPGWPAPS